jgi:hypothetical protein
VLDVGRKRKQLNAKGQSKKAKQEGVFLAAGNYVVRRFSSYINKI